MDTVGNKRARTEIAGDQGRRAERRAEGHRPRDPGARRRRRLATTSRSRAMYAHVAHAAHRRRPRRGAQDDDRAPRAARAPAAEASPAAADRPGHAPHTIAPDDVVAHARGGGGATRARRCSSPSRSSASSTSTGSARGRSTATPIGEGHSNVTYVIARGAWEAVLRRPPRPPLPPQRPRRAARGARAARAADTGRACRGVLAVCDDAAVIGAPFYVMEKLDGHVVTTALPPVARHGRRSAARMATSSSTRSSRSTPSTGGRPGWRASASRRLPRAPVAPLRRPVGAQPTRELPAVERGRRLARRDTCPPRRRRPSCTATSGSAT